MAGRGGQRAVPAVLGLSVVVVLGGCDEPAAFEPPPPPAVTVAAPVVEEVTTFREFTGRLEAERTVQVRARVPGFLRSIDFQEGQVVEGPASEAAEGRVLFTIEPEPFEAALSAAQASLAEAEASRELASARLERTQQALDQGAASDLELIEREAELAVAEASVLAARAQVEAAEIDLGYTTIHAPIGGRISRSLVDVGNLVGGAEPTLLTTIVSDDPMYAYIEVSERDLLAFVEQEGRRPNQPQADGTDGRPIGLVLADGSEYGLTGRFDFAETSVDPDTGTLEARIAFANPQGMLYPGMFVRVMVPELTGERTLVPETSVQRDLAGYFVLTVDESNTVARTPIEVAMTFGTDRIVLSGLAPEDRVIVNGIQRAFPGATVTPQAAGAASDGAAEPSGASAPEPASGEGASVGSDQGGGA